MTRHPRKAARRDANEQEIVDALLGIPGVSVHRMYDHADLLVGISNPRRTIIFEVKQPGKAADLTDAEMQFGVAHKGCYHIITSVEEAVRWINYYRNSRNGEW